MKQRSFIRLLSAACAAASLFAGAAFGAEVQVMISAGLLLKFLSSSEAAPVIVKAGLAPAP